MGRRQSRSGRTLALAVLAAAALPLALGCGPLDLGGQTGTEGTTADFEDCEPVATMLAPDDVRPLGFSAEEVLTFAIGTHRSEVAWATPGSMEVWGRTLSFGPESGEGTLELVIERAPGAPSLVHFESTQREPGAPDIGSAECPPDRIEIPVVVTLVTGGGALRESFETVLAAEHPLLASFSKQLPVAELAGTFEATLSDTANAAGTLKLAPLTISASVYPGGTSGTLSSAVELSSPGQAGLQRVTFGHWPAQDPCWSGATSPSGLGGVPVPLDAPFGGAAPAEALAQVQGAPAQRLSWSTGGVTELTLSVQPVGAVGCALLGGDPAELDRTPRVRVPVEIRVTTADGRVDSLLPGSVDVPIPGESTPAVLTLAGEVTCEAGDAAASSAECGVSGVALGSANSLRVSLAASFDPAGAGGPSGTLTLAGATPAECPSPEEVPPGSAAPGCAGWAWAPVETGTFKSP